MLAECEEGVNSFRPKPVSVSQDLAQWLAHLLDSESSQQDPDWELLEKALLRLQQRVDEQDLKIEALEPDDPARDALFQMGDHLHRLCHHFDQFLETGHYRFLRLAHQAAVEMQQIRTQLRRQLEDESQGQKIEL